MKNRFLGLFQTYAGLPKEVYVLFIARVINRLGGFVHAFLTLFLTIRMGMSAIDAGRIILYLGLAGMVGTMVGGSLGDILGRKRTYIIAQGTAALLLVPCGFLGNSLWIPYLLIISTFFNSIVGPISSAMLIDIVDKEDRKRAFSLLYYGINIGVAIGPAVAGALFTNHIEWIFWGDALTTLIALCLIGVYIKETKMTKKEIEAINDTLDNKEKAITGWRSIALFAFLSRPILVFYTLFSVLTSFVYAQSNFALPLAIKGIFGDDIGVKYFGMVISFNAVVVLVFTIIITKVTDRFRPIFNIAFANILYAVGFGMMAWINGLPMIFVSVFIWTIGEVQGVTNSGVFVANHTPITHRSRFNAIINILRSSGYMLAPLLSGYIIENSGMSFLWKITGGLSLIAFIGLYMLGLFDRKKDAQENLLV